MKNIKILLAFVIGLISVNLSAQVAVTTDGSSADVSAMLDVKSSTKGVLISRMTQSQRNNISSPATALIIYQTDNTPGFYYYSGSGWTQIGADADLSNYALKSNVLELNNTSSFTPSANYHPATKLYVDNSIPSLSNYALKTDVLMKTNTSTYTPTSNYHPATKKYVDDNMGVSSQWISNGSNIYYSTGNVGINTSSPTVDLEIKGGGSSSPPVQQLRNTVAHGGTIGEIEFWNTSYNTYSQPHTTIRGVVNSGNASSGEIAILSMTPGSTVTEETFRFNTYKQLGIGTSSIFQQRPSGMSYWNYSNGIEIANDDDMGIILNEIGSSNAAGAFWLDASSNDLYIDNMLNNADADIYLRSARSTSTYFLKLDATSGFVGIGSDNPYNKLHVKNASSGASSSSGDTQLTIENSSNAGLQFLSPNNTSNYIYFGDPQAHSSGSIIYNHTGNRLYLGAGGNASALVIQSSGNVAIGNSNYNTYKLQVNGTVAGYGSYVNTSDKRFKKDIQPIENALDKVLSLNGVTFNWNTTIDEKINFDDRNHIGFIAQDLEQVLPQVVFTAEDEMKSKSVAYGDVVPVLVEAIKEQQKQIEALKAEVEALKNK